MIRGRQGSGLVGIMLLVGAALILVTGLALAEDGARTFTAGSCPSVFFDNIYAMYCNVIHSSPPPECRGTVRICPEGTSEAGWAVNCPVAANTTISGPFYYSLDYSLANVIDPGLLTIDGCLDYEISVGLVDPSGSYEDRIVGVGQFCPSKSPARGNLEGQFDIPLGSRFGAMVRFFHIESPGLGSDLQGSENLVDGDFAFTCVDLNMNGSFYVNAPSSNPPYPICSGERVPTMTQWGLLLMSLGIAVCGVWVVRRKVARSA